MRRPVVSGGPVVSKVLLVGQAPGDKEPKLGRPFAWTAGRPLFRWFEEACGFDEFVFRRSIYMAAVWRCFPGKKPHGGDRVPSGEEVANCAGWLEAEMRILEPALVIPVGKVAIERFVSCPIAPPHPSGASPWPRMEPGKTLLRKAMALIAGHPAISAISG